jgi:shikimate 5-dehydrogenase
MGRALPSQRMVLLLAAPIKHGKSPAIITAYAKKFEQERLLGEGT